MKILITENQLNMLSENINISDYSEEDFYEIFYKNFRPWVIKKHGEEYEDYPISYLIKIYLDEFAKDFNITPPTYGKKVLQVARELVRAGHHKIPSKQRKIEFTKKYKVGIDKIIESLELPDFIQIVFEENRPYDVNVKMNYDFVELITTKIPYEKIPRQNELDREITESFKNYLGADYGNPQHGKLRLNFSHNITGIHEWIDNIFGKKIKKEIKQLPKSQIIHSIKVSAPEGYSLVTNIKIVFKRSALWSQENEMRENIKLLLKNLGYNNYLQVY